MRKARKKPAQNGNRPEDLLRVCARLFREQGFDGTSIRDISRAADMHSGSPFYHFKTKQEMLLAVMEQGLTDGLRHLEAVAALKLPPATKFRKLVRVHLGTLREDGHDFIPVMLYDWRSLTPANRRRVIALKDRYDALWQKVTDELQAEGLMQGDPQLARLFTFGVLNWTARWYRAGAPRSWKMSKRKVIDGTEIHEGSGNVYRDLGYPDADEMLVKAQLVAKISEIIRSQELTQVEAARILGVTQPKLSGLLRGQFRGISERKLIDCLTSLGRDVQIVVKNAPRRRAAGKLSVVFA